MKKSQVPESPRNNLYFLFWPVFVLRYLLLEQFHPTAVYHPVHCALDDRIPFLEEFMIPYAAWYLCIVGVHLWLYLRDDPAFIQYSRYLIATMSLSTAIFLFYPTCQNLRPEVFPQKNLLTDAVELLYQIDTSTNVCPSEHVIGSAGFFLAVLYARKGKSPGWVIAAAVISCLTAIATVFLKQHSVVDVMAALPVCWAGWYVAFRSLPLKKRDRIHRIRFGRFSA